MKTGSLNQRLSEKLKADMESLRQENAALMALQLKTFRSDLTTMSRAALNTIERDLADQMRAHKQSIRGLTIDSQDLAKKLQTELASTKEILNDRQTGFLKNIGLTWITGCLFVTVISAAIILAALPRTIYVDRPDSSPSLTEFGLDGSRVTSGLGRLGTVLLLPPDAVIKPCPVQQADRVCISTPQLENQ